MQSAKKPGLLVSLIPVLVLVFLLVVNVIIFKDDATGGANQIALLTAAFITSLIGIFHLKISFKYIEEKIAGNTNLFNYGKR